MMHEQARAVAFVADLQVVVAVAAEQRDIGADLGIDVSRQRDQGRASSSFTASSSAFERPFIISMMGLAT